MFKNKKNRIIISIFLVLIVVLVAIILWFYYPILDAKSFYANYHDNGFIVKTNGEKFKTVGDISILDSNSESYQENKYLISVYNPLDLTFVRVSCDEHKKIAYQFKIQRNLTGIDFLDYRIISANKYSCEQLTTLAKTYDLSKENPDPENITVFEPPTPEEIQRRQRSSELENNPEYKARQSECQKIFDKAQTEEEVYRFEECLINLEREFGLR